MKNRRAPPRSRGRQQLGAALLVAMVTVVLIATLASAAIWRQWRGIEVESAERTRVQSAWLLTGALDWARILLQGDLQEDLKTNPNAPVDHLGEPWAVPLAESRLSDFLSAGQASSSELERNAYLSGQILDLQSRLNVMNLAMVSPDAPSGPMQHFTRLFHALGLPNDELIALQRNLAAAYATMYPGLSPTAKPSPNAPLLPQRVEQLTWLGLDPQTLARLAPFITIIPLTSPGSQTLININTASPLVIYAAVPGLEMSQAEQLVQKRQSQVFYASTSAAAQALGSISNNVDFSAIVTNSSYFQVQGVLRLDDVTLQEFASLERTRSPPRVFPLWRARSALLPQTQFSPNP